MYMVYIEIYIQYKFELSEFHVITYTKAKPQQQQQQQKQQEQQLIRTATARTTTTAASIGNVVLIINLI